jgi:nicotinamide-nucleotide amidase
VITRLASLLLAECRTRGMWLATAESCTGGMIAAALTAVPGASAVMDRGVVTYSNASKTELLGVPETLIATHGAVSREVAIAMAEGMLSRSPAHLALSVTGIAGPEGGTAQKPVGRVYLACARRRGSTLAVGCQFAGMRDTIRESSVAAALTLGLRGALCLP